ncbi:FKBP-type peptidyl-prolyl cis-trans isomerase [Guillardia theta CCMP2712]|uniref:peptidylprolyl isomerase n=1 Tax=Guillardia theta (strain CCMP2712) TaxID=905079 RepID=L1JHP2_GUITC|nr:FKBP-type peptidyl-prolyl cis-trans isomerase [Guillardia theta CCMP2712]EKX48016.1 FKBP-type peptidyl-prolyl cis-trans isomerase [Guillardia theta CCMP2712]|eukprot:XP_005834996.1 FKBP-type peptidyl-prolyl cis-trans isomerase [Guillardia theta CCMP2712]
MHMRLRGGGEVVDLTGDGGVLKEILVEGSGDELPQNNDDVCVHYEGTLQSDGSKFDSSRDRNTPFTFKLGQGKVIKGWDKGVATMKRGEKAVFTIRSDYGYGAEGSGDKIPGNATLIFEVELLRWNEREITNDGGVYLKPLDKKGTGWRHPDRHDEVIVKYEGRYEGQPFTVSNDFEMIKLGSPSSPLPPGVERAICKEMKKGSNALITCRSDYAFGEHGVPGKVPPNADVIYEVELKDWNAIHDVAKDGGIIVKCLGQLDTYGPLCDDASKVTLHVEGKVLEDGKVFLGPAEKCITVGDGEMPEGFERGLEKIKKGQNAIITLSPNYAYGEAGNEDMGVPANATVQYVVNVNEVTPTYQLQLKDKLAAAEKRKEQGNVFFKSEDLEKALNKYDKAFKLVQYEQGEGDEAEAVKNLKSTCHTNKAAVLEKQGKLDECIAECTKSLDIKPTNVKALFRRGKAYCTQNRLEDATKDLKQALTVDPENKAAKQQLLLDQKDKKVFGKMFAKPGALATEKPASAPKKEEPAKEEEKIEELGEDTRIK